MNETVCILFVGDVVGGIGKRTLLALLPGLRDRFAPDFVVVNGENAAGGVGITPKIAREMLAAGVDVITLGNHTYRHREIYPYLDEEERILRPANFLARQPGHGWCVVRDSSDSVRLGVVSLSGNLFMKAGRPAFAEADAALHALNGKVDHVLVDMHAEATSEKVAMGRLLDGKVTAVIGTHTHIQTNDATVLPGGTAYLTDAGMTGPHDSVIGVRSEIVLRRFLTQLPQKFEVADGDVRLEGALVECDPTTGRATAIETVRRRL